MDSFVGGFVIQSIVSLWFYARFWSRSFYNIIHSIHFRSDDCFLIYGYRMDCRQNRPNQYYGFYPSNILIIAVVFVPSLPIAAILYFVRMAPSQMDVPTRQSYIVSIVRDEERTAATGITNIARNISQTISSSLAGYIIQSLSLFLRFF